MKGFITAPLALAAVATILLVSQRLPGADGSPSPVPVGEGKVNEQVHWYLVDQDQGQDLAGQSRLNPDEVASALAAGKYFSLSDYRTMDANGQWSSAKRERVVGTIYIKPTLVRSFQEITGDPMLWAGPKEGDDG